VIPEFVPRGTLPPGVHNATWKELAARFGTTPRRQALLQGLRRALVQLRNAGCHTAWIDGSFVTAKPEPQDFDGCWAAEDVDPDLLDPVLLDFRDGRAAQKAAYGGELFVASSAESGSGITYREFFQTDHEGRRKGIVALQLQRDRSL
jgi:hypothetical protein